MRPIHPGKLLREEFLIPLKITPAELARVLKVPPSRIYGLVNEKRGLAVDIALRLARYFSTDAMYWMKLQGAFELHTAKKKSGRIIKSKINPRKKWS